MKKCPCGFTAKNSLSGHAQTCVQYKKEFKRVTENAVRYVADMYLDTYSVAECVERIIKRENSLISHSQIRKFMDNYLDSLGIREGISGENSQRMKQIKIVQSVKNKYGVDNVGQLPGNGWSKINNIPYEKLNFVDDMAKFRKKVNSATEKTVHQLRKKNNISKTCHYTNIQFNDVLLKRVNPNDPFKRTVDHIIPVTEAFLRGLSVEETASENNIVFCLRVINTLKSNTSYDDFVKNYLPYIKEKLNESKICHSSGTHTTTV
jgi:5-methylcytosine-specific restriction endonuclease McrA